jgi:SAM-dependent methyltransferase
MVGSDRNIHRSKRKLGPFVTLCVAIQASLKKGLSDHMAEFWEVAFIEKQLMWGFEPARSAVFAGEYFARVGIKDVLIPGVGYGRNAKVFLAQDMSVTGIEISETAITLARTKLNLTFPIYQGSVTEMPYDHRQYDGIFCYGMIYLLNAPERAKFIQDCHRQLAPGGVMIFTVISKKAPMYGRGPKLGDDWYEIIPGVKMYFYDTDTIAQEFGPYGLLEFSEIDEPARGGSSLPFINIICKRSEA